jgi:asparagine synthase (glutamine-hydrolysing)
VTVALNGDGGDENFAGYRWYVAAGLVDKLARLPSPLRATLAQVSSIVGANHRPNSFRSRLYRVTHAAQLPPEDRYLSTAFFDEHERAQLYTPDFHASLGEGFSGSVVKTPYLGSDADDEINRRLDVDVQTYLAGALLVKMDIASMAHSLEVRSPLLDHHFMELAAGLRGAWKVQGRTTKKIFKDALRAWLPDHILQREKHGFGVPVGAWFRGELRDLPREILLDPRSLERGLFRKERVHQIIDDHVAGLRDNGKKIWALIQFELWLRTFIDTSSVDRPPTLDVGRVTAAI